jgi:hypothetical protein
VQRTSFQQLGLYDESLLLIEDMQLVTRLKRSVRFALMPFSVVTSARKYLAHGSASLRGCIKTFYIGGASRLLPTW